MDQSMVTTRMLLAELFSGQASAEVGVRLWDGTRWPDDNPRPTTLVLDHPGALRRMFLSRKDIGLAEAYLYDDFDIQGDIEPVFPLAEGLAHAAEGLGKKLRLARDLLRLPGSNGRPSMRRGPAQMRGKPHSIERDRRAIAYHYKMSQTISMACGWTRIWSTPLPTSTRRRTAWIKHSRIS